MGAYDEALAKSLSTGDSRDLGSLVQGERLEKAHVQAHFRRNPKTGALEHIADYDDSRHAAETALSVKAGDKMQVNNPKSKFHGKAVEVLHYSDKYNCVRTKAEGVKHTADFKPEHLERLEAKKGKPAEVSKLAEPQSAPTHPIFEDPVKMKSKLVAALKKAGVPFGQTSASKQVRGWHSVSQQGVNITTAAYERDNPKTIELSFLERRGAQTPLKETDMYKKTKAVLEQGGFDYTSHDYGFTIDTKNHFLPEQHKAHELTQKENEIQRVYNEAQRKNKWRPDAWTRELSDKLAEIREPARQARIKAGEVYEAHQSFQKKLSKNRG